MPIGKQHLQYFDEAINSVINQTYPNWTLWIFFDIKKDLINFGDYRSKKIKILWDGNIKKQTIRRNQIIDKVKDDYVCFLDADDIYLPNRLEIHNKLLANGKIDWSYGDCIYFNNTEEWHWKPQLEIKQRDLLYSCCGIPIGSVTFRTDYLKTLNGFDPNLVVGEDWELYYRAFEKKPYYIPIAHYKKRVGTSTCRHFPHSLYRWRMRNYMRKKHGSK